MKTYLDCYPCFLRQALDAARLVGADERPQEAVLHRLLDDLCHPVAAREMGVSLGSIVLKRGRT